MLRILSLLVIKLLCFLFIGKIEDFLFLGENIFNNGFFLYVCFRKKLYFFVFIDGLLCLYYFFVLKNVLIKVIWREKMKI